MRPILVKNRPVMSEERDRRFKDFETLREEVQVSERLLKVAHGKKYFIRT